MRSDDINDYPYEYFNDNICFVIDNGNSIVQRISMTQIEYMYVIRGESHNFINNGKGSRKKSSSFSGPKVLLPVYFLV